MKRGLDLLATILAVAFGVLFLALPAAAGEVAPRVPIDKTRGDCVLPAEEMRREHMNIIKHRRDATMYQGIRGGKEALESCLSCHAVKGDDGKPVTIKSEKHFCRVCHDYAAVTVDCWACHKSVPEKNPFEQALRLPGRTMRAEASGLAKYLEGGER
jgi:predicted CXXCH cytochrome family protein